jgi:hypothetical protein
MLEYKPKRIGRREPSGGTLPLHDEPMATHPIQVTPSQWEYCKAQGPSVSAYIRSLIEQARQAQTKTTNEETDTL